MERGEERYTGGSPTLPGMHSGVSALWKLDTSPTEEGQDKLRKSWPLKSGCQGVNLDSNVLIV